MLEPAHPGQLLNFQNFCKLVVNPLVAWNQLWWENSHYTNWQNQFYFFFFLLASQLLNIYLYLLKCPQLSSPLLSDLPHSLLWLQLFHPRGTEKMVEAWLQSVQVTQQKIMHPCHPKGCECHQSHCWLFNLPCNLSPSLWSFCPN